MGRKLQIPRISYVGRQYNGWPILVAEKQQEQVIYPDPDPCIYVFVVTKCDLYHTYQSLACETAINTESP